MRAPLRRWSWLLLLPHPALSLAYLLAVRANVVQPAFTPLVLLAAFPLVAAAISTMALWRTPPGRRATSWSLLAIAILEIIWAVLALAMLGFAIAWRSG